MITGVLGTASISTSLHLFEEPNFEKYIISVYGATTAIACTVNFVTMVWKSSKIFEFIADLEHIVQISEYT